jgi:nicotinamide mononucleotide transporter
LKRNNGKKRNTFFLENIFNAHTEFFKLLGYSMSYLEFFGVLSGLLAVWLSAKANSWSWPVGIINVILAFFLYYQVQLYPDMFLQIFFFVTNIAGWWRWTHPRQEEADRKKELKVSYLEKTQLLVTVSIGIAGTLALGFFASRLHVWAPALFALPGSYPYVDSFILIMSIVATFYMIQKKIECWLIWIAIDMVATVLYYIKEVKFFSLEYLIFAGLAYYGLRTWMKEYKSYTPDAA